MNSRERVLAAINHKEPDKIPIDLGSTHVTGINAIAYNNLKKYLGITTGNTRIIDVIQQLAQVEDIIIDRFQIDVLGIGRAYNKKDEDWYDIDLKGNKVQFPARFRPRRNEDNSYDVVHPDGTILAKMSEGAFYFEQNYFPFLEGYPDDFSDLIGSIGRYLGFIHPPAPFDNLQQRRFWRKLRETAIELSKNSNKALTIDLGCSVFEFGHALRRIDNSLMDLVSDPSQVEKFLDKIMDFHLASLSLVCKYVGDVIDVIRIGDDLGENKGPLINPKLYRKIFKPRHAEICDYIKKHSSMKIFFHSCGSIKPFIPDLIDVGVDILNPVQINVRNMDPKELKEEYGDDITFWGGGADTRNVINRLSPKEVEKHVTELLEIFSPGGGFIWSTIHNILPDVPPENIVAMFDAIHKYNDSKK
ncbi:MAG: methyltransferase [Candidatus Helarchaeota archaeon]|nr:methyltransferase [Candidatus Helarchaeota archaeon]